MAGEIPKDLPLAPNGEVKAYDRVGNKITVPKDKVGELYGLGGRVAAKAEVADAATQEAYDKQGTLTKAATLGSMAGPLGYPLHAYMRGKGAVLPPGLEAYTQGVSEGFTGGAASVGMKELVEQVGGKDAAHAYGKTAADVKETHEGLHTAGTIAGFIGGAAAGGPKAGLGGAAKAIPSVGISAAGGLAERSAAQLLAPVAARGAIGRAIATGGELAARGAMEGALYSAASSASQDMLGDVPINGDKLYAALGTGALYGGAGGAVLGGAGSLVASGARETVGALRSGISKAMAKGEGVVGGAAAKAEGAAADLAAKADAAAAEASGLARDVGKAAQHEVDKAAIGARNAVADTVGDAAASGKGIAEATGTSAAQESSALKSLTERYGAKETQHGWAQDQAWKSIGAGQGLQSTTFAKSAERYLPNGTRDIGEVLLRKKIINVEDGLVNAMKAGTPEAMLPKITAAREAVGERIGAITAASPAKIAGVEIGDAVSRIASKYEASAATRSLGRNLRGFGEDLRQSLGITDLGSQVTVQDLLRERKAIDHIVFENAALDPSLTIQVKRELRSELEALVMKGLDDASGQLPGTLKAEYKALKHDYTALSIANDAAEDSAARMAKGATFGLTDTLRGGGSVIKTIGSKLVRERGNAAAAVLISRMADMGTITRAVAAVDEQVGRAAKGILTPPAKKALPEKPATESLRTRAQRIMDAVAEQQANPERMVESISRHTEPLQASAPGLADAVNQRLTSAAAFMASKIPSVADVDPLDPHPARRLTDAEAYDVVRYDTYVRDPMRFFKEAEHGKLTFEGAEVAAALMPDLFADLQQRTITGLAELMARKAPPPHAARERIGMLMSVPAVPSQRPDHMGFLQKNVLPSGQAPAAQGAQPPKRPFPTKTQPSTLDRLEGK